MPGRMTFRQIIGDLVMTHATENTEENTDNDVTESEDELVDQARGAVSQCNWIVGECAAKWTRKYARGRTDGDFAALVGLSADQVYQRRRVWETFGDVSSEYPTLKWSHFYIALRWDDAPECLQWAIENEATVAEMKAWRRVQRGEDKTEAAPADPWVGDPAIRFVPTEPVAVRDPSEFSGDRPGETNLSPPFDVEPIGTGSAAETISAVARGSEDHGAGYSPFRKGAGSPAPGEASQQTATLDRPPVDPEQLIKRVSRSLERINAALTPDILAEFRLLPDKDRVRFVKLVGELGTKAAGLM